MLDRIERSLGSRPDPTEVAAVEEHDLRNGGEVGQEIHGHEGVLADDHPADGRVAGPAVEAVGGDVQRAVVARVRARAMSMSKDLARPPPCSR